MKNASPSTDSLKTWLGLHQLESREVPATLSAIDSSLSSALNALAQRAIIAPAVANLQANSVQKDVLAGAAPALEAFVDNKLKEEITRLNDAARSGRSPSLAEGYRIDLQPKSGRVARLTLDTTSRDVFRSAISDGHTGFADVDSRFEGRLTGSSSASANTQLHLTFDVKEGANGVLSVELGSDCRLELNDFRGSFGLAGTGTYGELADVSVSTRGTIDGSAVFQIDGRPTDARGSAQLKLSAVLENVFTSNSTYTRGVTWSSHDTSRIDGARLGAVTSQTTAPKALDLLKASVRGLQSNAVPLPDGLLAGVRKALDIKVPFTGKTLGDTFAIPTEVNLSVRTLNVERYTSFSDLVRDLGKDKNFSVLLGGEAGAASFAQGKNIGILQVHAKEEKGFDINLGKGPSGTYEVLPGVTLSGRSGLSANIRVSFEAIIVLDGEGLGFREGTNAKVALKLTGELEGRLDVLPIAESLSLLSASVKAGAYVEGSIAATLGKPLDEKGNPTGAGVYHLTPPKKNSQRTLKDYVNVKTDLRVGVEISTKVKAVGFTIYGKHWSHEIPLASSMHAAVAKLT